MRVVASARVAAPLDKVWSWWTDFGEQGSESVVSHGAGAKSLRRVVSRQDGHLELEERTIPLKVPLLRHSVVIHPETREVRETSDKPMPYRSRYTFERAGDGTLVTREYESNAWWGKVAPAAMVRRMVQRDLDHHCREAEQELRGL